MAAMRLLCAALLAAAGTGSLSAQSPAPWWVADQPLRIIDEEGFLGGIGSRPAAEVAASKSARAWNAEHLHVMFMNKGLDDQGFYFSSKVAGKQNLDFLKAYLPEAKKRGIRVFIYFDVHWYNIPFGQEHPDWQQIKEDGKPVTDLYDTGTTLCVNTPWREWVFQVLRDLAAYPIDGIFFDGPCFYGETCYCKYCRAKWDKQHPGVPMPSKHNRKGKVFQDFVQFQAESLTDFLHDSRVVLKGIRQDIALYMNGGARDANWATGRLNRVLVREQDLLGSEGGFIGGDLTRVPIWKPGVTARLLETQAPAKPRIIFSAASHKPWTFSILPGPELKLLYAGTIANAAGVWFGITPFEDNQPEMKALGEMNRYLARNVTYYKDTKSAARVALVWSDTTANSYAGSDSQLLDIGRVRGASDVGNLDREFSGLTDALMRSHTPFDVIDDVTLERDPLSRYAAIILPNVASMKDATVARLREYVRAGGSLFATFETSLYDENGARRPDFALADVLGVNTVSGGKIVGPTRWDFLYPAGKSPLLAGISREMLPSTLYHVQVAANGATAVLKCKQPLAGRYDGIPADSPDPALTVNQFGKGRAVYASGDLGNVIANFHMAEHLGIARNTVRMLAPSPVTLTNAADSVEVVLRSQQNGKRLLLHLINSTAAMTRPIEHVTPLENVTVSMSGAGEVKKVSTLMRPGTLSPKAVKGGAVEFTLPRLDEYEVVVIEK